MSNVTLSFPEFPDNTPLAENTSYVVTMAHPITVVNAIIPKNVTLYFYGGRLDAGTTGIELVGNETRLVAPIDQIFGTTLKVGGLWCIDRAYPQWFGAKAYYNNPWDSDAPIDSATAINKAINMNIGGIVFLTKGNYYVGSSIKLRYGTRLMGESGAQYAPTDASDNNYNHGGTTIIPHPIYSFKEGFLILVNIDESTLTGNTEEEKLKKVKWEIKYPAPATEISNIMFISKNRVEKCILTADSTKLETLRWYGYKQAVVCAYSVYLDMKVIRNCSFNTYDNTPPTTANNIYIFDLRSQGEALVFENNSVGPTPEGVGALRIDGCLGGKISSNILNADVMIMQSKAVIYEANHMEVGAKLTIKSSCVSLDGNYFQMWVFKNASGDIVKSDVNLEIGSVQFSELSVVTMNNDQFIFWDYTNDQNYNKSIGNINPVNIYIDNLSKLSTHNVSRQWFEFGGISRVYTHGICINKKSYDENPKDFPEFNNFSYRLSDDCNIYPGFRIDKKFSIDNINQPLLGLEVLENPAEGVKPLASVWREEGGIYTYSYQIVYDKARCILKHTNSTALFDLEGTYNPSIYTKEKYGPRFRLTSGGQFGDNVLVRLFRKKIYNGKTTYKMVEVPVTGTSYIFDNGISICAYLWKDVSLQEIENMKQYCNGISSISYNGSSVECKATSYPSTGTWQESDIVYNTNPNGTNSMWIYLGGAWKAR